MKFFFDRNISIHIARMIAVFDRTNAIIHQDDDARFVDNDDDSFIITTIGAENPKPIWVTSDITQKKVPAERLALKNSGMHVVFFKRFHKNADAHYQAMKVLAVWPALVGRCATARVATAFEVPAGPFTSTKIDVLGPTLDIFV